MPRAPAASWCPFFANTSPSHAHTARAPNLDRAPLSSRLGRWIADRTPNPSKGIKNQVNLGVGKLPETPPPQSQSSTPAVSTAVQ